MYVEKLSKEEIMNISKTLLNIVEDSKSLVDTILKFAYVKRNKDSIELILKSLYEDQQIYFSDFSAGITYGYYDTPEKINKTYRKFMYNKFGEQYKLDFEKEHKKSIEKQYHEELDNLQSTIDEFTK